MRFRFLTLMGAVLLLFVAILNTTAVTPAMAQIGPCGNDETEAARIIGLANNASDGLNLYANSCLTQSSYAEYYHWHVTLQSGVCNGDPQTRGRTEFAMAAYVNSGIIIWPDPPAVIGPDQAYFDAAVAYVFFGGSAPACRYGSGGPDPTPDPGPGPGPGQTPLPGAPSQYCRYLQLSWYFWQRDIPPRDLGGMSARVTEMRGFTTDFFLTVQAEIALQAAQGDYAGAASRMLSSPIFSGWLSAKYSQNHVGAMLLYLRLPSEAYMQAEGVYNNSGNPVNVRQQALFIMRQARLQMRDFGGAAQVDSWFAQNGWSVAEQEQVWLSHPLPNTALGRYPC